MTSLTPTSPAPDKSVPIVLAIAGAAVVVIVLGVLYGLIFGGWAAGLRPLAVRDERSARSSATCSKAWCCWSACCSRRRSSSTRERKIWGAVQLRRGPNVVGPWGTLQPFADFLKFILKEPIIPSGANKGVFLLAPLVGVVLWRWRPGR